jgi:small subunit ribosomal protein S13
MSETFREIVRVQGVNLDGSRKVAYALTGIKGVGLRLANIVVKTSGLDKNRRLGHFSESEISKIERALEELGENSKQDWIFNRRKDLETGEDVHIVGSDLDLREKADIDRMKATNSWKGYRHSYGLKVRGQKTKATGRKKSKAIGVKKREALRRLRATSESR